MSNSVRPHRRQSTRLPRSWDSPGKNTGLGCHFLLQCMKVKSGSEKSLSRVRLFAYGLQPIRLLCPWDFPGRSTGVGCQCLLRSLEHWVLFSSCILHISVWTSPCFPISKLVWNGVHHFFLNRPFPTFFFLFLMSLSLLPQALNFHHLLLIPFHQYL